MLPLGESAINSSLKVGSVKHKSSWRFRSNSICAGKGPSLTRLVLIIVNFLPREYLKLSGSASEGDYSDEDCGVLDFLSNLIEHC